MSMYAINSFIRTPRCLRHNVLWQAFSSDSLQQTDPLKAISQPQQQNNQLRTPDERKRLVLREDKMRIKVNPRDTTVMLFPGQGSQFVGMGAAVFDSPNVDRLFEVAKTVLGYDLLKLCLEGPFETLSRTEFCQPAVFVTSLAAVEHLRGKNAPEVEACVSCAGFSIGEITALVFSGALSYEDGLRLVKFRAEAMQYASEIVPSAMATIFLYADAQLDLAFQAAREWCLKKNIHPESAVCGVANHLFPHCKVIAGHEEALQFLEINSKHFGIKKMKRLPVSGAFHTKLMEPVKKILEEALKHMNIEVPLIPTYSNYDGRIYRSEKDIRKKLTLQVCNPVKWEQIMHSIYDRKHDAPYPKTFECGPGTALTSILTMVNREARQFCKHVKV